MGRTEIIALLLLAGCGPAEPTETIGESKLPIAGGYADAEDTAVVAVVHAPTPLLCSGTLIAPNLVLTARHCVSSTSGGENVSCDTASSGAPYSPAGFLVSTAAVAEVGAIGESFVSRVFVPPAEDAELLCGRDIAALLLEDPVPAARAVPLELRLDAPAMPAEIYSAVGYGLDESGTDSGVRRRRDDLALECVGSACMSADVADTEWLGEGAVCQGDSGGPALAADGRVFGVASRGESECGRTVYASTSEWAAWLRDVAVCASGAGLYDAPAWTAGSTAIREHCVPMGGACQASADCPGNACVIEEGYAPYCSRPCVADGDCPDDYMCQDYNGAPVCRTTRKVLVSKTPVPRDTGCTQGGGAQGAWWLALAWLTVASARSRGSAARERARQPRS